MIEVTFEYARGRVRVQIKDRRPAKYASGRHMHSDTIEDKGFPELRFLAAQVVGKQINSKWETLENVPDDIRDYGLSVHGEFMHRFRMAYNVLVREIDTALWRSIFETVGVKRFQRFGSFKLSLKNLFPGTVDNEGNKIPHNYMIDGISINSIIYGFRDRRSGRRIHLIHERAKVPVNIIHELNETYRDEYGIEFRSYGHKVFEVRLKDWNKLKASDRYAAYLRDDNDPRVSAIVDRLKN